MIHGQDMPDQMDQEGLKMNQEGVKRVCLDQKKVSFLSKKFNSVVKLTLEPGSAANML